MPQALADEFGIKFYETSAKKNMNVDEAFTTIARDIMLRLQEQDAKEVCVCVCTLPRFDGWIDCSMLRFQLQICIFLSICSNSPINSQRAIAWFTAGRRQHALSLSAPT